MQEVHADKVLMLAIGNNDYISYNKLFDRYYGRLCQYVYSLLMDRNDAEDVVQELFLNLWKNRGRIEIKENVSGYLYRMAKHLALNFIRSKVQTGSLSENQDLLLLSYEDNQLEKAIVELNKVRNRQSTKMPGLNSQLETEEFRIALYDCIDHLPGRSREVLLLHRVKGLKQKEISEKLSISVKTIKNQIWMSLQKLKECLEMKEV